jgi:hypothetical protein
MRVIVVSALALSACGGAHSQATPDAGSVDSATGGHVDSVSLPQSIGGAAWVDPDAYQAIPVHVAVVGDASSVSVAIDGATTAASAASGGEWIATVPVASLADGEHQLTATATGGDGASAMVGATLVAGRAGMQWTSISADGLADTPRLFHVGDALVATWTDQSDGTRSAWLQPIDGAGRSAGARVRLAGGTGQPDVLAARTVHGKSSVAVLYQTPGGAYSNWLTIVSDAGATTLAPMALDPANRYGSWGGDITYDGSGFVAVWRTNDGAAHDDVRWIRVDEATGAITGPFVVAASGNDAPDGGFDPFTFIGVRSAGDGAGTVVSFLRYEHSSVLETDVPKCQLAAVSDQGTVGATTYAEAGTGILWDHECRLLGSKPVLMWGASDLTSSDANPPVGFFADAVAAGALPTSRGDGHLVVTAADNRTEPAIVETAAAAPTLAWLDERTYANPATGRIELYTAPLGADLTAGAPVVFEHARPIEGTSELGGAAAYTNAILSWIDERHGGTINNPRPEVYFETVWN